MVCMAQAGTVPTIFNGRSLPTSAPAAMCLKMRPTPLPDWTRTETAERRAPLCRAFHQGTDSTGRSAGILVSHALRPRILLGPQSHQSLRAAVSGKVQTQPGRLDGLPRSEAVAWSRQAIQ